MNADANSPGLCRDVSNSFSLTDRFFDNWGIVSTAVNLPQPEAAPPGSGSFGMATHWHPVPTPAPSVYPHLGPGQQGRLEAGGEGWIDSPSHSIHPLLQ